MATLPAIELPPRLPHTCVNKDDFEMGFDEKYIEGGIKQNCFLCAVCQCFPRHPCFLETCGHLYCEICIKKHFQFNKSLQPPFLTIHSAACPVCKERFRLGDVTPNENFQQWALTVYKSIEVKCPQECGFKGNAFQVDDHQVYECPKRPIRCPNSSCTFVASAEVLESTHFAKCPFLRVFCGKCNLPVPANQLQSHDCIRLLQEALAGT